MIRQCTCQNNFMDSRYGQSNRIMNPCDPDTQGRYQQIRCVVCLAQYPINNSESKSEAKKK